MSWDGHNIFFPDIQSDTLNYHTLRHRFLVMKLLKVKLHLDNVGVRDTKRGKCFLCCCKFWLTTECTNYDLKLLLGTNQTDSHGSALPAGLHFSDIRDQETNHDAWIKNENKTLYLISRKFDTWIRLRTEKGEKCRNSPQICHFLTYWLMFSAL